MSIIPAPWSIIFFSVNPHIYLYYNLTEKKKKTKRGDNDPLLSWFWVVFRVVCLILCQCVMGGWVLKDLREKSKVEWVVNVS